MPLPSDSEGADKRYVKVSIELWVEAAVRSDPPFAGKVDVRDAVPRLKEAIKSSGLPWTRCRLSSGRHGKGYALQFIKNAAMREHGFLEALSRQGLVGKEKA